MHQILLVIVARFFNRGNALRPVHRIKHVIDKQFTTALNVVNDTDLILAVDAPVLANVSEVETGSKVNGIFLSLEVVNTGTTGVFANAYMIIYKNPGGNLAVIPPNNVGNNDNKRYVIHQEMLMLQFVDNSNPRTLFKGVIVLPRGYRRFGPNDSLRLRVFSPGVELSVCLQCHYKEFR